MVKAPPVTDLVVAHDYVEAMRQIVALYEQLPPQSAGTRILARTHVRLDAHLERHLFGDTKYRSEDAALATLKSLAAELQQASKELQVAAEAFKQKGGMISQANRAWVAHLHARDIAGPYLE